MNPEPSIFAMYAMTALTFGDGQVQQVHGAPVTISGPLHTALVATQPVRLDGAWRMAEQAIATTCEFAA